MRPHQSTTAEPVLCKIGFAGCGRVGVGMGFEEIGELSFGGVAI
jgi:hypothetical protein